MFWAAQSAAKAVEARPARAAMKTEVLRILMVGLVACGVGIKVDTDKRRESHSPRASDGL